MLIFRRAYIERGLKVVVVETKPGFFMYLPGPYDCDKMLDQVIKRRYIDEKHWRILG